jgi:hypothetical protein
MSFIDNEIMRLMPFIICRLSSHRESNDIQTLFNEFISHRKSIRKSITKRLRQFGKHHNASQHQSTAFNLNRLARTNEQLRQLNEHLETQLEKQQHLMQSTSQKNFET